MARRQNITDRAQRYRAQANIPAHEKVCVFCGASRRALMVGHLDGNESHGEPENLSWVCRPCNTVADNTLRNAGMGRRTHQYNPTKAGGARSVGEWMQAVGAITPHIDRGDRGLVSDMKVSDAVDMIRATPHSKRSEFWRMLRRTKRERDNPGLFGPGGLFGSRDTVYDIQAARRQAKKDAAERARDERRAAAERARGERERKKEERARIHEELLDLKADLQREKIAAIKAKRAGEQSSIPDAVIPSEDKIRAAYDRGARSIAEAIEMAGGRLNPAARRLAGRPNPSDYQAGYDAGAAHRSRRDSLHNHVRWVEEVERGGRKLSASERQILTQRFGRGFVDGQKKSNPGRRNPAQAAADNYEEFHGEPSRKLATVQERRHYHRHVTAAGELFALIVDGVDHKRHVIRDFGKNCFLTFNEKKTQLYITGGDQSINLSDYGIKPSLAKENETLGKLTGVEYYTTKTHLGDEGGTAVYHHKFRTTNENGQHVVVTIARYPDLFYRVLDEQLEISGGSYTIRREGIDL